MNKQPPAAPRKLRLAVIGYGNAGRAFGRMLAAKHGEIVQGFGADVQVVSIHTRSRGSLHSPEGINLPAAEAMLQNEGRLPGAAGSVMDTIKAGGYDALVELTPISIMDGQPAIDHIRTALELGKHAVTANKGPVAWAYRELCALAARQGCRFLYETTVMDGTPVFNMAQNCLRLCRISGIRGILNATTNFILGEMEGGSTFEAAVEKGRQKGFVEADPAMDIDGWDAAAKLAALMNALMDAGLTPLDIQRQGIRNITAAQLAEARRRGSTIKLVCEGRLEHGRPTGRVAPQEVPLADPLATITGAASIVSLHTDLMGEVSVLEHEHHPEIDQTAYGILSDVLRLLD